MHTVFNIPKKVHNLAIFNFFQIHDRGNSFSPVNFPPVNFPPQNFAYCSFDSFDLILINVLDPPSDSFDPIINHLNIWATSGNGFDPGISDRCLSRTVL
jgi:hypothetical protein